MGRTKSIKKKKWIKRGKKKSVKKKSVKKKSVKKKSVKKKSVKKKTKKYKRSRLYYTRKITDTTFPYLPITKTEAVGEFLRLREIEDLNPKSLIGNKMVDYGTYRMRVKTKYRGKSWHERWQNLKYRKKLNEFARRIIKLKNLPPLRAQRDAMALQWGTINTMRPAAAVNFYRKYKATRVLDFTAGWGARMIGAMVDDIDYIGIDSNKKLKKGYDKIIDALKPHHKSKIKLYFKKAEEVDFSKIGYYDLVFTSPPYEYLEVYENMKNYEGTLKIKQPSSATKIKKGDSSGFYDDFLIPTIKKAYKYLPKGKWLCLNIPDLMYSKIRSRWKKCDKKELYRIVRRQGSTMGVEGRRGLEFIYCWQK